MAEDREDRQNFTRDTDLSYGLMEGLGNVLGLRGLGAEFEVAEHFGGLEWESRLRPSYFDLDGRKSREFDLRAGLTTSSESPDGTYSYTSLSLAIEVKGVRHTPWLVLRPPKEMLSPPEPWNPVVSGGVREQDLGGIASTMRRWGHPRFHPQPDQRPARLWIDAGITEPFRPKESQKRNPPEIWLEASRAACKAAEHVARERKRKGEGKQRHPQKGDDWSGVLHVAQPVVVLDGLLISVARDGEGGWTFEKIPAAQIEFEFATDQYTRGLYRVDVVTVDHLPHYIRIMELLLEKLHTFNEERIGP